MNKVSNLDKLFVFYCCEQQCVSYDVTDVIVIFRSVESTTDFPCRDFQDVTLGNYLQVDFQFLTVRNVLRVLRHSSQ